MKYLLSVVFGVYFLSFVQMQGAYAQRVSEPTHAPLPTLIVLTPTIPTPTTTPTITLKISTINCTSPALNPKANHKNGRYRLLEVGERQGDV